MRLHNSGQVRTFTKHLVNTHINLSIQSFCWNNDGDTRIWTDIIEKPTGLCSLINFLIFVRMIKIMVKMVEQQSYGSMTSDTVRLCKWLARVDSLYVKRTLSTTKWSPIMSKSVLSWSELDVTIEMYICLTQ